MKKSDGVKKRSGRVMKRMDMTEEERRYFHLNFTKMMEAMGYLSADSIIKRRHVEEYGWQRLELLPSRKTLLDCFKKEEYAPSNLIYHDIMEFYSCNFEHADTEGFLKRKLDFCQETRMDDSLADFFSGWYYCYYDIEKTDPHTSVIGGILYFYLDKNVIRVKAILGFRDDSTMRSEKLQKIITEANTELELERFRQQLEPYQKRLTFYEGEFCERKDYSKIELRNAEKNAMICFQTVDRSTQTKFQSCVGIFMRISKMTYNLAVRKIGITNKFFSLEDKRVQNCIEKDSCQLRVSSQESNRLFELVIGER